MSIALNPSDGRTASAGWDDAAGKGLVSEITSLRERQAALDERYKTLVAQLGAELYVKTRRDAAFRAPHEDLYAEIEETAVKCKQGRDRLSELEARARALGLSVDRGGRSIERETIGAHSIGRHATPSEAVRRKEPIEVDDGTESASSACSRCGAEIEQGDAFCGMCGAPLTASERPPRHGNGSEREALSSRGGSAESAASRLKEIAPDPASRIDLKPLKSAAPDRVGGIFDIIAILLTFVPWVGLNLYVWSGSYSLPGLIQIIFKANNTASNYLGSSYTGSDVAGAIFVVVIIVAAMWVSVVLALATDAYARLSASRKKPSLGPLVGFVCMAAAVIAICFIADTALASQFSKASLSVSGIVFATLGAWISLIAGIAFLAYLKSKSE